MPCLTTWAHSCSAVVLPMWTMSSPKGVQKQSHGCSCQGCKASNHTGTLLNLPKHWNSPEPSEPSGSCLRNLHQHTTEPSGTFRNLPPEPTPAHTGTLRNLLELASRTYTSKHRSSPELSGTLRNLPPEPTPAHTGTLRNLPPEPAPSTRTSTHRSLSGLKTPLAYAVGEKATENHNFKMPKLSVFSPWASSKRLKPRQKIKRYKKKPTAEPRKM